MINLTAQQLQILKQMDVVEATRRARHEAMALLNDQGFTVLSLALSNLIVEVVEHPERLVNELRR